MMFTASRSLYLKEPDTRQKFSLFVKKVKQVWGWVNDARILVFDWIVSLTCGTCSLGQMRSERLFVLMNIERCAALRALNEEQSYNDGRSDLVFCSCPSCRFFLPPPLSVLITISLSLVMNQDVKDSTECWTIPPYRLPNYHPSELLCPTGRV